MDGPWQRALTSRMSNQQPIGIGGSFAGQPARNVPMNSGASGNPLANPKPSPIPAKNPIGPVSNQAGGGMTPMNRGSGPADPNWWLSQTNRIIRDQLNMQRSGMVNPFMSGATPRKI